MRYAGKAGLPGTPRWPWMYGQGPGFTPAHLIQSCMPKDASHVHIRTPVQKYSNRFRLAAICCNMQRSAVTVVDNVNIHSSKQVALQILHLASRGCLTKASDVCLHVNNLQSLFQRSSLELDFVLRGCTLRFISGGRASMPGECFIWAFHFGMV